MGVNIKFAIQLVVILWILNLHSPSKFIYNRSETSSSALLTEGFNNIIEILLYHSSGLFFKVMQFILRSIMQRCKRFDTNFINAIYFAVSRYNSRQHQFSRWLECNSNVRIWEKIKHNNAFHVHKNDAGFCQMIKRQMKGNVCKEILLFQKSLNKTWTVC